MVGRKISESEWRQLERDLRLAKETGCRYHVCHVSCKESVALLRRELASPRPLSGPFATYSDETAGEIAIVRAAAEAHAAYGPACIANST